MKVFWIAKALYKLCAIHVSEQQNVMTVFKFVPPLKKNPWRRPCLLGLIPVGHRRCLVTGLLCVWQMRWWRSRACVRRGWHSVPAYTECSQDGECPGETKCCNNGCGAVCSTPCQYWVGWVRNSTNFECNLCWWLDLHDSGWLGDGEGQRSYLTSGT